MRDSLPSECWPGPLMLVFDFRTKAVDNLWLCNLNYTRNRASNILENNRYSVRDMSK